MSVTVTLAPTGYLASDGGSIVGSWSDLVNASDGLYMVSEVGAVTNWYAVTMTDLPADAAAIESVSITARLQGTASSYGKFGFYSGGSHVYGSSYNPTSFTAYTNTFATAPGGVPWTVAGINACGLEWHASVAAGEYVYFDQLFATVHYAAWGGWISLIGSILGPVLGAHVLRGEVPRIVSALADRGHLLSGAEATLLWESIRSATHPVFFA